MLRTGCRAFVAFAGGLRYSRGYGQPLNEYESKDRRLSGPQAAKRMTSSASARPRPTSRTSACATPRPSSCRAQNISCASYSARRTMRSPSVASRPFSAAFYTLTPEFDRMGCRLDGELIEHVKAATSSPTASPLAPSRCPRRVSRSSCWPTARPPADMQKSPTSSPQTFAFSPSSRQATKCASKRSPSPLHRRLCLRSALR